MGSVAGFSAINTKIRAFMGKMLTEEQYLKLLNCKDFKNTVNVLKEETSYGELLKDCNLEKIHRSNLELILQKHYISIYSKIIKYFNGEYRKFIRALFCRFEIEDLKVIIRGKYLGRTKEQIEDKLIARSPLNTINYDYLMALKSVEEVVQGLKGSIYHKHLKSLTKDITERGLFKIETELDFIYFSSIRKVLKDFDNENKEVSESIIGIEADLLNLGWIYRGKAYYNIPPDELFNYIIYNSYKLSKEMLRQLCYTNNMTDFRNLIGKTPYADIYEKDDSTLIEKKEREFQKQYFKRILRENKTNISMVMSYLIFYRIEMRDIISIIEEKRYNMNMNECIRYISMKL
jgi:V/A-type H+-transporting ATPase subunit C